MIGVLAGRVFITDADILSEGTFWLTEIDVCTKVLRVCPKSKMPRSDKGILDAKVHPSEDKRTPAGIYGK